MTDDPTNTETTDEASDAERMVPDATPATILEWLREDARVIVLVQSPEQRDQQRSALVNLCVREAVPCVWRDNEVQLRDDHAGHVSYHYSNVPAAGYRAVQGITPDRIVGAQLLEQSDYDLVRASLRKDEVEPVEGEGEDERTHGHA